MTRITVIVLAIALMGGVLTMAGFGIVGLVGGGEKSESAQDNSCAKAHTEWLAAHDRFASLEWRRYSAAISPYNDKVGRSCDACYDVQAKHNNARRVADAKGDGEWGKWRGYWDRRVKRACQIPYWYFPEAYER